MIKVNNSNTPLYKKLGIKEGFNILVLNQPKNYIDFFTDFPQNITITNSCENEYFDFIHIFAKTLKELETFFLLAKSSLKKNGTLWVSWHKKTSKIKTELDKFIIMKYGLSNGLVDTKITSIDENWSGYKFVYRLKDR